MSEKNRENKNFHENIGQNRNTTPRTGNNILLPYLSAMCVSWLLFNQSCTCCCVHVLAAGMRTYEWSEEVEDEKDDDSESEPEI